MILRSLTLVVLALALIASGCGSQGDGSQRSQAQAVARQIACFQKTPCVNVARVWKIGDGLWSFQTSPSGRCFIVYLNEFRVTNNATRFDGVARAAC